MGFLDDVNRARAAMQAGESAQAATASDLTSAWSAFEHRVAEAAQLLRSHGVPDMPVWLAVDGWRRFKPHPDRARGWLLDEGYCIIDGKIEHGMWSQLYPPSRNAGIAPRSSNTVTRLQALRIGMGIGQPFIEWHPEWMPPRMQATFWGGVLEIPSLGERPVIADDMLAKSVAKMLGDRPIA